MRTSGLVVVGAGLVLQVGYALAGVVPGAIPLVVAASIVVLAGCVLALGDKLKVVAGWVTAVLLAVLFAGAVADRFGLLGEPGAAGVVWGDWAAFVGYTGELMPWAPGWLVEISAAGATVAEIVLVMWLVSGWARAYAGMAAAALLVVFLVSMTATVGLAAVASNAVVVLLGGALLIAVTPARSASVHPVG
ncbi:hypothetical protein JNUCC0626_10080 [Lentzea sp. JNUCC 0626]|uniref:hypothetical protein n=1 Tax=Lentzea sp. JNUCC 0626 TaxID=3367513 RepID=UPI003749A20C